ncbi:MAG: DUF805 domain-containing protein [Chitinispirillia bacterium]|nr:DUF805 domain-containing protein [Chitinispirillia bacterium]
MATDTPENSENALPGEAGVLAYAGRLSLWGYFVKCLKKCVDFSGRARRREFWAFALFYALFSAPAFICGGVFAGDMRIPAIFALILALPGAAALVRRLHDTGKSGWHILKLAVIPPAGCIFLSPVVAAIGVFDLAVLLAAVLLLSIPAVIFVMIIWLCRDSEPFENVYGPNPKENDYLFYPGCEPIAGARAENPQERRDADGPDDDAAFIVGDTGGGGQSGANHNIPPPSIKRARCKFKWKIPDRPAAVIPVLILAAVLANWLYIEITRAPAPVPPGTPDTRWYEANRKASVFYISTADELAGLAAIVNGTWGGKPARYDFADKTINLNADIDLRRYDNWVPVGGYNIGFSGVFDGGSHVISNLTINRPDEDFQGLFGHIEYGKVQDLGLENVDITGDCNTGGIAGSAQRSGFVRVYSTGTVKGGSWDVGGLVGVMGWSNGENSHIISSYSTVAVSGEKSVGGLVGSINYCSYVLNSYSAGAVSGGDYRVGGLLGQIDDRGSHVTNSAALNPYVESYYDLAGRVAGVSEDQVKFSNNVAFPKVRNSAGLENRDANNSYGADITAEEIRADGTIGGRFTNKDGWTTENGRLPGLFGGTVEMPVHLR